MNARDAILSRLQAAPKSTPIEPDVAGHFARFGPKADHLTLLRHWAKTMRSVKTDIIWTYAAQWPQQLRQLALDKQLGTLLLSPTAHGQQADAALADTAIQTRVFNHPLDDWKTALFDEVDAGFTAVKCGIAATGTLVVWPGPLEPRTMSLVPPVHIALFDTTTLYPDFFTAQHQQSWANGLPTNSVLISGPSKTADIQLTLAYGAHGPRELIVLAVLSDDITVAQLESGQ